MVQKRVGVNWAMSQIVERSSYRQQGCRQGGAGTPCSPPITYGTHLLYLPTDRTYVPITYLPYVMGTTWSSSPPCLHPCCRVS